MPRAWPSPFRAGFASSPWEFMRSMSDEFDRLFDDIAGLRSGLTPYGLTTPRLGRGAEYRGLQPSVWSPQIEVVQKPNAVLLQADLPGIKPDEVDVNVEDGMLTISGERTQEHKEEREGYLRSERSYGQFYRAIPLPDGADENNVKATFKNGVLEINVPFTERRKGKKIKVEG